MTPVRTFRSSALPPYERGVEFGEAHREQVGRTVAAYRRLYRTRAEVPFDLEAWSRLAWEAIERHDPLAAEEIAGIARGAGVTVAELASVNARTELLAVANPSGIPDLAECSTVVSLPGGADPVAVQTWDWYDAMADGWLHWTIPHPDGRVVETVTEYGMLGKIGVSSTGLGVMLNMLQHGRNRGVAEADGVGHPVHLLSRRVLDGCDTVTDAVRLLRSHRVSASTSLTVVDERSAASVELFPGGPAVVEPDEGLLVRTNHFLSREGADGCLAPSIGPGSSIRRDTLLGAFKKELPRTAEAVLAAMEDHAEVGGVCAHVDPSLDPVLRHATLATVTVHLRDRRLGVVDGGPCRRRAAASA